MLIILENVRTFFRRHRIPVAPLTLLVGENSSGKTTFLAMVSALFSPTKFPSRPPFNEPPYDLGSYDTIATYRGGRSGRAKSFRLGYSHEVDGKPVEVIATYAGRQGQPVLREFELKGPNGSLNLSFEAGAMSGEMTVPGRAGGTPVRVELSTELPEDAPLNETTLASYVINSMLRSSDAVGRDPQEVTSRISDLINPVIRLVDPITRGPAIAQSIAPIRTKPRRTYDVLSDEFRPEGDHIPFILAKSFSDEFTEKQRTQLRGAIEQFGLESGLYQKVLIKRLGTRPSAPFQVMISVSGPPVNLPDVGYGVSQALPIVVQSILTTEASLLLLQQPEVHLHPKAQAALGSFFVRLAVTEARQFIIETHSDYLVDRVRQEIARGAIDPANVSILFFYRKGASTRLFPISIDRDGNLSKVPGHYRDFFLREEQAMLGLGAP